MAKMAVVVQRMVAAEAAGVLFTANIITGARDEIIVEASPGRRGDRRRPGYP
jgi:pyruvate,water dikinase